MCEKYNLDLLGSVPLEPDVSECCELGKSILSYKPESLSAQRYTDIYKSIFLIILRAPGKAWIYRMSTNG